MYYSLNLEHQKKESQQNIYLGTILGISWLGLVKQRPFLVLGSAILVHSIWANFMWRILGDNTTTVKHGEVEEEAEGDDDNTEKKRQKTKEVSKEDDEGPLSSMTLYIRLLFSVRPQQS